MEQETKANLGQRSTWMRLVYMILFVVVFNIVEVVAGVVVVVQFLSKLISGRVNEQLRGLGQKLGAYLYEIVAFLTFHTDDMPYPFSPWPDWAPGPSGAAAPQRAPARRARAGANPSGKGRRKPAGEA